MNKKRFLGFTLAELLITLGVIGIVASLTIPALMNNYQDAQFKAAYKKAYTVASQALMKANADNELTSCVNWFDTQCNLDNFTAFKNKFSISKDCPTAPDQCWNMSGEKTFIGNGGYPLSDAPAFIDNSGFAWTKPGLAGWTGTEFMVDTNGNKPPNQYGKDRALFNLINVTGHPKSPSIGLAGDMTDSAVGSQLARCPSVATTPCYYTSWITGSQ